jgi:hypothetical protein
LVGGTCARGSCVTSRSLIVARLPLLRRFRACRCRRALPRMDLVGCRRLASATIVFAAYEAARVAARALARSSRLPCSLFFFQTAIRNRAMYRALDATTTALVLICLHSADDCPGGALQVSFFLPWDGTRHGSTSEARQSSEMLFHTNGHRLQMKRSPSLLILLRVRRHH